MASNKKFFPKNHFSCHTQGVLVGLSLTLPFRFVRNGRLQLGMVALLEIAKWPTLFKWVFAPIVDSIFWTRFGRRKCWIIPVQLMLGTLLAILAAYINTWLDLKSNNPIQIGKIAGTFVTLVFLSGIHDIAMDGWCLTLFPPWVASPLIQRHEQMVPNVPITA